MVLGDRVGDQLAQAVDHGEQVVEVVRDPAGEKSDRLHLLGLEILRLEVVQRGDVLDRAVDPHGDSTLHLDLGERPAPDRGSRAELPGIDEVPAGAFRLRVKDRGSGPARVVGAEQTLGLPKE